MLVLCLCSTLPRSPQESAVAVDSPVNVLLSFDRDAFEIAAFLTKRMNIGDDVELLRLSQLILNKAAEIGVEPHVLLAVIDVESTYDHCARSRVGAQGLMQVMPYRILGRDEAQRLFTFNSHLVYDPYWNIAFGAQYLGDLIVRFDSLEAALAAYNAGPTRIARILDEDGFVQSTYASRVFRRAERIQRQLNI